MKQLKGGEHHWWDLGVGLGVQLTRIECIRTSYQSDHQRMKAVMDEYIIEDSKPSWKKVAVALQEIDSKLAYRVTAKCVRGKDINHVIFLIRNKASTY